MQCRFKETRKYSKKCWFFSPQLYVFLVTFSTQEIMARWKNSANMKGVRKERSLEIQAPKIPKKKKNQMAWISWWKNYEKDNSHVKKIKKLLGTDQRRWAFVVEEGCLPSPLLSPWYARPCLWARCQSQFLYLPA